MVDCEKNNGVNGINGTKKITDHIVNDNRWGGYIYNCDFETDYRGRDEIHGSPIAQKIESNFKFDEECRKNSIQRDISFKYRAEKGD